MRRQGAGVAQDASDAGWLIVRAGSGLTSSRSITRAHHLLRTSPFDRTGQALMACRSSPLLVIEILRGLACSATGILNVSTPES